MNIYYNSVLNGFVVAKSTTGVNLVFVGEIGTENFNYEDWQDNEKMLNIIMKLAYEYVGTKQVYLIS